MLIWVIVAVSCKESKEATEKTYLTNAIENIEDNSQYDWIIILPGLGCHGCIQEGELFMKKNISNRRILFVLTNIESLKILQQKTGIKISNHPNVFIDRKNQFKLATDNAIYPCVIRMKNGEILQYAFQSPQTTAFHDIEQHIKIEN